MPRNTSLLGLGASSRVHILLLGLALLLPIVAFLTLRTSRPEGIYQGKPSSYWVQLAVGGDQSPQTLEALKALGPEVILPLLDAMQGADSIGNSLLHWAYDKVPWRMRRHLSYVPTDSESRSRAYMVLNLLSDSVKPSDGPVLVPRLISLLVEFDKRPSGMFVDYDTHMAIPHGCYVRSIAAEMLASLGPNAEAAVPALTAALRDERWDKYFAATVPNALGRIGPRAKSAVPTLKEVLKKSSAYREVAIAEALWRIDPSEAEFGVPILESALIDTNQPVRLNAARVHWKMQGNAKVVLPVLLELLRAQENPWRAATWEAVGEMGPWAREALPELKVIAGGASDLDRKAAQEALAKIEPSIRASQ